MAGDEHLSYGSGPTPGAQWRKVLNQSWPAPDVAARLRDVEPADQILVRVRVVFETGEEWMDGRATRWVSRPTAHVRVMVNDQRVQTYGVWVDPSDVRRR